MDKIKLLNGEYVVVDAEDYPYIAPYDWSAHRGLYAHRRFVVGYNPAKKRSVYRSLMMHRLILEMHGIDVPKGMETDHINGNGLDNRKENLRVVTISQNRMNRPVFKSNGHGDKGVSWRPQIKKWESRINIDKKRIHLGWFSLKDDALKAYRNAAKKYFGVYNRE